MNLEFAKRLTDYRKKAGLSQEELALKLGVSRQAVSKWECGESSPDTDNLIALSKIYHVSLDELVGVEPTKEEPNKGKSFEYKDKDKDVSINLGNVDIHVKDDEGNEVHIDSNGIKVNAANEKKEGPKVSVKLDNLNNDLKRNTRLLLIEKTISSTIGLLVVLAYLLLGFLLPNGEGWRNYWVLFFLIPVLPSLFAAIRKKRFTIFVFPVAVVMLYCSLGMFLGLWHPTWVIFFAIPLYYSIFGPIDARNAAKRFVEVKEEKVHPDVIDNDVNND